MNNRNKILTTILVIFAGVSMVSGQSLSESAWKDTPSYFEDSTVEVRFSEVVEEKESYQKCTEYENSSEDGLAYGDCLSYSTDYYGGENTYIFGIEDIDYWYIGNGSVHLEFDVVRNDLTKELFKSKKNPRQQEKFIDYFNSNYLFRDRSLNSTSYDSFLGFAESVSVSSLGESLKAKSLESKNLMAVSNSRIETVIKLQDFRNGGAEINDAVTVEVVS